MTNVNKNARGFASNFPTLSLRSTAKVWKIVEKNPRAGVENVKKTLTNVKKILTWKTLTKWSRKREQNTGMKNGNKRPEDCFGKLDVYMYTYMYMYVYIYILYA